jgi:hypothetical protein
MALLLADGAQAQNKPKKVGTVLDIDGPRLMTNRHQEGSWFQAYPTMPTNLGERMMSDPKTTATLEFSIGGRAVITPSTEIEIVGQRDIEVVGNKILVKSGKMWAKIDKQNSQLQIETSGGTMGIEGTEFLVEVDGDETELTLLEGTIAVTGADGQKRRLQGGQALRFGKRGMARRELAQDIREALAAGDREAARELMLHHARLTAATRGAVRFALARNRAGARLFRNPATACMALRKFAKKKRLLRRGLRQPQVSAEVSVSGMSAVGAQPTFSWDSLPAASSYSVVLSQDAEGLQPLWSAVTDGTSLGYPAYGPDLVAGQTYHWSVLPLKADGSPLERAAEICGNSIFTAQGFQGQAATLVDLVVTSEEGLPLVSWENVAGAGSYQVAIAAGPEFNELVWADTTAGTTYRYPQAARGLPAGDYLLRVDALDEFGVKMGSDVVRFSTPGWTSAGSSQP